MYVSIYVSILNAGIRMSLYVSMYISGGRTAHSQLKLPFADLTPTSICTISAQSALADLLKKTSLIVWDEVSMSHKYHLNAIDNTLRDIRNRPNDHFGGITMLFCGDFRQVRLFNIVSLTYINFGYFYYDNFNNKYKFIINIFFRYCQ